MYDFEVMCRQKLDTPWSIYRDFTVYFFFAIPVRKLIFFSFFPTRYDPYRRPEFYEPYMMVPRGMASSMYYQGEPRKERGDPRHSHARAEPRADPRMDPGRYGNSKNAREYPRAQSKEEPTRNGRPIDSIRTDSMRSDFMRSDSARNGDSRAHFCGDQPYGHNRR